MPVSSNQHQIYVDGLAQDEPTPILRMNSYGHGEDGIAAIRSLIFMRAQDGLMQRLLDYVFNDIEVPLGRMKLVLEKNPDERRDSIFDAVHEAITNAEGCVLGYSDMLKSAADKKVLSSMTKTNKHWIRRFDELIAQWQVVAQAHQTFKAIARRDGRHYIKKRDETTDWNGDVVEVISPSIQLMVRDFKEHCDKRQTQLLESFNRTLDNLRDTIKTDPNIGGIDMTTIFQLLETHKKHFEQRVPLAFAELADNIEKIGNGILPDANEIRAGGSVGWNQGRDFYKSMKSIYLGLLSDAKFRPGTKRVTARRWAYLRERLRNTKAKNPMSSLKADFKYRFTNVLNDFTNCIMDIMQDPFREISADLEARFGRYEDFQDQATRDTIKAALEKVLPQARAMFDEAQECLNYAVEWEKEHTQVKRPPAKVVRVKAEDFLDDMVSDLEDEDEDDDEDGGETEDSDSDLESEAD
ncbi:hypothetical protein KVT40_006560 [Elsinoe batatas]|uniref:DUF7605 domain-containing protein n=1 Tax=Elsinoe batatas TaxID=2601811 RepID=A0A8K0PI10_9PEZI|nr:hypothetical protein KVT40_006560 [Elsinoe batatas]